MILFGIRAQDDKFVKVSFWVKGLALSFSLAHQDVFVKSWQDQLSEILETNKQALKQVAILEVSNVSGTEIFRSQLYIDCCAWIVNKSDNLKDIHWIGPRLRVAFNRGWIICSNQLGSQV